MPEKSATRKSRIVGRVRDPISAVMALNGNSSLNNAERAATRTTTSSSFKSSFSRR